MAIVSWILILIYYFYLLARGGAASEFQRKGTRVNMVPIKMLEPGQKLSKMPKPQPAQ